MKSAVISYEDSFYAVIPGLNNKCHVFNFSVSLNFNSIYICACVTRVFLSRPRLASGCVLDCKGSCKSQVGF